MLQQFIASKQLEGALAIVLGDFFAGKIGELNLEERAIEAALLEFAERTDIPVLRYIGIGHGNRNFPVPLATAARLNLGSMPVLTVSTGASVS
jgi:muramoyltetrapeptide carboxypeptidase LdcA involved in peptidoglycan recycling